MSGQLVDATPVPAPGQRNAEDGKAAIREGRSAHEIWRDAPDRAARKDADARWTLEIGGKVRDRGDGTPLPQVALPVFGDKSHIGIDRCFGIDREGTTTSASGAEASGADGRQSKGVASREDAAGDVWADSACRSRGNERWLAGTMMTSRIHRRRPAGRPMPEGTAGADARTSSTRAHVEHVFARRKNRHGPSIPTIGLVRAGAKLALANLACDFDRLIFHARRPATGQVRPKSARRVEDADDRARRQPGTAPFNGRIRPTQPPPRLISKITRFLQVSSCGVGKGVVVLSEVAVDIVAAEDETRFRDPMQAHHHLGAVPGMGETVRHVAHHRGRWRCSRRRC